ncbi:hemicentin-1-like isoform X2 [Mercenaria mercenaria]|uniref:hemicentin-1-like isoform X2 n=1 Tax=Mercenaria mercenaria TaxID=6596 RepID=UPI00234EC5CA|nr:hemicentin-1-like isoform X2 [Mercenaria mercenaria]
MIVKLIYVALLLEVFISAVEGWNCVSTAVKVYSRINAKAVLQFDISADVNPSNSITFSIRFYNGTVIALVRYMSNGEITIQKLPGVDVTADASGNVAVTLINVGEDNQGVYFISGGGSSARCNCLYILGIPSKAKISVNENPNVGSSMTLTCTSTSTTTPNNHSLSLTYNWKVNDVYNPSGTRYIYSTSRKTLTLLRVEQNDIDKQFTCSSTENVIDGYTSNNSDQTSLRAIYGPKNIYFSPTTSNYTRAEYTDFNPVTCKASCNPGCSFQWTKIGEVQSVSNTSELNLKNLTRTQAGTYICTAMTSGGFSMRKYLVINVIYGPDTANISVHSPYNLTEGEDQRNITCSSDCYPGCTYSWKNISSSLYISSNGLLHLQYVNRFVSGRYICTARNTAIDYAHSSDAVVMVNVEYPALISSFYVEGREGEINTIAEEHADIQFTCITDNSVSSTIKIMFNDHILKMTEAFHTKYVTFTRRKIACSQGGLYVCEGTNLYAQTTRKNITMLIKCAPRPQRQLNYNITSSLNVPARLSFTAIAYHEPGPTGFLWHKEEARKWIPLLSNDDLQMSSSGLQTNLTILNVSHQNFGQYRLTVMNDIGKYEQYMFLEEKGGTKYETRRERQTYTNEVPLEDTHAEETSREARDINDPQYTSLDDAFKDRNDTYEKIGTTET